MCPRGGTWGDDILAGTLSVYYNQVGKKRNVVESFVVDEEKLPGATMDRKSQGKEDNLRSETKQEKRCWNCC